MPPSTPVPMLCSRSSAEALLFYGPLSNLSSQVVEDLTLMPATGALYFSL